jgi:predicted AAA+ superfamily ATPase
MTFPRKAYRSLEDPDVRLIAERDPRGFFSSLPEGGILDEIHRLPSLLSYIQGITDRKKKKGLFILTGSHQPELHQAVSQSLAGRTAVLTLLPFTLNELRNYRKRWKTFDLIVKGSLPRLHQERLQLNRFFNSYIQTYVERDVRTLINLKDLDRFQQFLLLLAGRIGQVVNYTALSNDIGVSSTTIKSWISALKASFLVFSLPPFHENIRKRVVKSPKIYFTDSGLACFMLGIENAEQAARDPLRGPLYENLVILEILKARLNRGMRPELYFYRDSHGNEVDLIIRSGRQLLPIEIKSGATFTDEYLKGIFNFRKVAGKRFRTETVLYNGDQDFLIHGVRICNPLLHDVIGTVALGIKGESD